jgi:hypothetical protein
MPPSQQVRSVEQQREIRGRFLELDHQPVAQQFGQLRNKSDKSHRVPSQLHQRSSTHGNPCSLVDYGVEPIAEDTEQGAVCRQRKVL